MTGEFFPFFGSTVKCYFSVSPMFSFVHLLSSFQFPCRCLTRGYLEYLTHNEEGMWVPDLSYYCTLIGRLVDSILNMLISHLFHIFKARQQRCKCEARCYLCSIMQCDLENCNVEKCSVFCEGWCGVVWSCVEW